MSTKISKCSQLSVKKLLIKREKSGVKEHETYCSKWCILWILISQISLFVLCCLKSRTCRNSDEGYKKPTFWTYFVHTFVHRLPFFNFFKRNLQMLIFQFHLEQSPRFSDPRKFKSFQGTESEITFYSSNEYFSGEYLMYQNIESISYLLNFVLAFSGKVWGKKLRKLKWSSTRVSHAVRDGW